MRTFLKKIKGAGRKIGAAGKKIGAIGKKAGLVIVGRGGKENPFPGRFASSAGW